jgi:chitinase
MIRPFFTLALGVLLSLTAAAQPLQKEVVGYFPSWKWKTRGNLVRPTTLPYDKLTMINYAFFAPREDGSIAGINAAGDSLYLSCGRDTSLTTLAHAHGVRVLLSLGGWDNSEHFPRVASTVTLRAAFAHACVAAMREWDFDGIDIDWEFPGMSDHRGTTEDKHNFSLLLETVRDSLLQYDRDTRNQSLLSVALPAGAHNASGMEIPVIAQIVDFVNIMTYDFSGSWDERAYHNAPLYASAGIDSGRSVDGAFALYHDRYNLPADKLNLGVPFYGQTFTQCTGLLGPHHGPDTVHFSPSGAFYYDIVRQQNHFVRSWDSVAQVPYLVSKEWHVLVSYDDEASVRAKAEYVRSHDARGLIIWEITGDYLPAGTSPLLDALVSVFRP